MTGAVEKAEDFGSGDVGLFKTWDAQITLADKEAKKWFDRADQVIKRYRDERKTGTDTKKYNILWSNTETLKPAVYARSPKPLVSRRYKDKDQTGKDASRVLERALVYHLDAYDFDAVVKAGREDYLLPGRGIARVRYIPTFGEPEKVETEEPEEEQSAGGEEPKEPFREVVYEEARCEYHYWKDFLHGPARKWTDVPWVAFKTYQTRRQLSDRFGAERGGKIPLTSTTTVESSDDDQPKSLYKKAVIWEIWDKENHKVHWFCPDFKEGMIESGEPPLNLDGFFPTPRPVYIIETNDTLEPIPEYVMYQDQAEELDQVTDRINRLIKTLKVAGVYAADAKELQRMLDEGVENQLIPVDNWAAFADRGGLDGMISWLPIEQIIKVVLSLYESRERTKQEIYDITGMADIVRGSSKASETAAAQRIKSQFATVRLSDKQREFSRWVRDLLRLKAEVIAEQFSPQTLQMMTGLEVTEEVMALLKSDTMRGFKIDIETDSTIQPDEQAEKEARVEFLTATGSFIEQSLPVAQAVPEIAPLLGEMLLFGVRGFRAGRELEERFEEAVEAITQAPQQGQQDQGKALEEKKLQMDAKKTQGEQQLQAQELQLKGRELELRQQEMNQKELEIGIGELVGSKEAIMQLMTAMQAVLQSSQATAGQAMQASQQNTDNMVALVQAMSQGLSEIADRITAPKAVIRDESGRPVGVETIQ